MSAFRGFSNHHHQHASYPNGNTHPHPPRYEDEPTLLEMFNMLLITALVIVCIILAMLVLFWFPADGAGLVTVIDRFLDIVIKLLITATLVLCAPIVVFILHRYAME